jgi:mRNA interferase MazF
VKHLASSPERGDLVWLDFMPQSGREIDKRRPALILSPKAFNSATGFVAACPITSKGRGSKFEVALDDTSPISGVILSHQFKTLDWRSREIQFAGKVSKEVLNEVTARIAAIVCFE